MTDVDRILDGADQVLTRGRKRERPLLDPETDGRQTVGLRVAAKFLKLDARTVRARIESRALRATRDGKVYRIAITDLVRYKRQREAA